jgi:hypothetical protein
MDGADGVFADNRLVLLHKHGVSARTRFLRFADGGVCAFAPLPDDTIIVSAEPDAVAILPGVVLNETAHRLGIAVSGLEIEPGFAVDAVAGGKRFHVHLARFTAVDPPFDLAAAIGARFIDLTEARGMPSFSLMLMRHTYEAVMGG